MKTDELKILLLGGTGEAAVINEFMSQQEGVHLITSLAGRTVQATRLKGEVLPKGFADVGGLSKFLTDRQIDLVVDMTHPFARVVSPKTQKACAAEDIPYIRYERPAWTREQGDTWIEVETLFKAAAACADFSNIFLSIGRQELGAFQHLQDKRLVVRSVEPITFECPQSDVDNLLARGPFELEDELALLRDERIDVVVTKNSGGDATYAKIEAARTLGLPVIMVERPATHVAGAISTPDALKLRLQSFV